MAMVFEGGQYDPLPVNHQTARHDAFVRGTPPGARERASCLSQTIVDRLGITDLELKVICR